MGNYFSATSTPEVHRRNDAGPPHPPNEGLNEVDPSSSFRTPRKRKKSLLLDSPNGSKLNTPTRKKLKNTSKYIYETLFENGQDSDVTITALGTSWRLHRVYLCQSAYFRSMFSGNWAESSRRDIDIHVPDKQVTHEALGVAFGSLYKDEVAIKPVEAINILATASLLQLDTLIQHCEDVMKENIGPATVTKYYDASVTYGIPNLRQACFSWLLKNLMTSSAKFLAGISPDLMADLVADADLFVMQVEMDVYTMLKKWLFLQLEAWDEENTEDAPPSSPSTSSDSKSLSTASEMYLSSLAKSLDDRTTSLLETPLGKPFANVFRQLRLQHIVNDLNSLDILEKERLLPSAWLSPLIPRQWRHLLRLETEVDTGPSNISTKDFRFCCLRCGRVLLQDVDHCWRWTGFHFGVDLLISYQRRQITIKRNAGSHKCLTSVSLHPKRDLMISVHVAAFDKVGHCSYEKSSALTKLSLAPDEEWVILCVDRHAPFPLYVSVKMLFYTPLADDVNNEEPAVVSDMKERGEDPIEDIVSPQSISPDT